MRDVEAALKLYEARRLLAYVVSSAIAPSRPSGATREPAGVRAAGCGAQSHPSAPTLRSRQMNELESGSRGTGRDEAQKEREL